MLSAHNNNYVRKYHNSVNISHFVSVQNDYSISDLHGYQKIAFTRIFSKIDFRGKITRMHLQNLDIFSEACMKVSNGRKN